MPHIDRRRICFYTSMFKGRSSAQEIAECAVKKGVGAVELMNFSDEFKTPSLSEAKRIGKYARENSLSLPCFSVAVDFLVEEKRRDSLDYLKAYADLAAYLEIPYLHHTLITCFDPTGLTRPVDELMPISSFF